MHPEAWIKDPQSTPYTWTLQSPTGVIIATEFSNDGVETAFREYFTQKEVETQTQTPDGQTLTHQETKFIAPQHMVFRILPLREGLPELEFDFEAGTTLIFEKLRKQTIGMNQAGEPMPDFQFGYQTQIFGRKLADGREQVLQIWPSGEMKEHNSLAEARAHH